MKPIDLLQKMQKRADRDTAAIPDSKADLFDTIAMLKYLRKEVCLGRTKCDGCSHKAMMKAPCGYKGLFPEPEQLKEFEK